MRFDEMSLKHNFTDGELAATARDYAARLGSLNQLEAEAKSVATGYKARMDCAKAELQSLSVQVNNGFEMRNVRCLVLQERPESHEITIRLDLGRIVKRRKLESTERQMKLLAEAPKPWAAVVLLPIDDPDWHDDLYQCPVREDEFETLRHVPGITMQNYVPPAAMLGNNPDELKKQKRARSND
jgi:hypothetical protein